MELSTKFNIGDKVFTIHGNKPFIAEITDISIEVNRKNEIETYYFLRMPDKGREAKTERECFCNVSDFIVKSGVSV